MIRRLRYFLKNEGGAVTVDWVVLTAIVCGLAIAAIGAISTGTDGLGSTIQAFLTDTSVESIAGLE